MSDETNNLQVLKMVRTKVISFRLDEKQFSILSASMKRDKPIGIVSENDLARKIVCDLLAGRLRYLEDADRKVDLDKYAVLSLNLSKPTNPFRPPTFMRYARVERILSKEPGFAKLLTPKKDIVYRPDAGQILCSRFVIHV